MRTTLQTQIRQHREQLQSEAKATLSQISDDLIELAYTTFEAGLETAEFDINHPNA